MFRNYFTIALRSLLKQKGYAFINIFGLAVGLTCFILVSLLIRHELSYDTFHEHADRIYRVVKEDPGYQYLGSNHFAVTPAPLTGALMDEFPEVEFATYIETINFLLTHDDKRFYESGIHATEHFFDVFSFKFVLGNPETALREPNSILLTESLARKYFGNENPVGRTLTVTRSRDRVEMHVVGIVEDAPRNSHFSFNYIISAVSDPDFERLSTHWDSNNIYTYALLRPDHDEAAFASGLLALAQKKLIQYEYYQENPDEITQYYPQLLTDIHLHSDINFEVGANGDLRYIYLFSAIGFLILLIACINYINLATARSASRGMEVGVRKAMGAQRVQLIGQFIGEAVIRSVLALVVAIGAVQLLMPIFNELTGRSISSGLAESGWMWIMLLVIGLFVGIASGSYPALLISSLHPAHVMKSGGGLKKGKGWLRNALVVVQFTITITLIVCTLVIQQQLHFIKHANTGVDRDQVVSIRVRDRSVPEKYDALKRSIEQFPNVLAVSASYYEPYRINSQTTTREWEGAMDGQQVSIHHTSVREGYLEMFDIQLVEGNDFSPVNGTGELRPILINETLKRQLGWEEAVGKTFTINRVEGRVIGVMKDFNFQPFHQKMEALALYPNTERFTRLLVKLQGENVPETLSFLEETMAAFSPSYPFEFHFVDDAYNQMYLTEVRLGTLFSYFTMLALCIACLGLLGLATFTVYQRTKEIGIRKVLGASLTNILVMLSKDFTRLVVIAFLISSPIAYIMMREWLQDFAYRTSLDWTTFLVAGLGALFMAWLTVCYQSIRAAIANPVDSLRSE